MNYDYEVVFYSPSSSTSSSPGSIFGIKKVLSETQSYRWEKVFSVLNEYFRDAKKYKRL